ncbi:prolyl oligopeptidase family serine peptidase [Glaesserella sp.]|uniref:carboxylesterase family protein n=1 Tax=Glaesserella sp. TaxID=2094731 RepID=UPI0035A1D197
MKLKKLSALFMFSLSTQAVANNIVEATALSTPAGSGQQVNHVLLKYREMTATPSVEKFDVTGRKVINALSVRDCPKDRPSTTIPYCHATDSDMVLLTLEPAASGFVTVRENRKPAVEREVVLEIKPKGENTVKTTSVRQLVAEDFTQHIFTDETTGIKIPYNLYVPKNYTPTKSYPLVMFIHDAGSTNSNVKNTLYQGNGATAWASPEWQAKEEAFVLAPQFDHTIVNDKSEDPADLEPTINLIKLLTKTYNIDNKRIYTTGQSGGGMMSIAMNIKHPDFFAASYLVASQWEPTYTAPMAKNNLFVLVSENDPKAFPTQQKIMQVLAKNGAVIKKSFGWNGEASVDELDQKTKELVSQGGNVHFATFAGGTLQMEKEYPELNGTSHLGTWWVAYNIDAVRDWLFAQKKD